MICPECKSEYREGFTHCSDCDVDLVDQLPVQPEADHAAGSDDLVIVFVSVNGNEAAQVESLLEGSGVEVTLLDEHMSRMDSPVSLIIGGVKVAVSRQQETLAREVLAEFRGGAGQNPEYGSNSLFASSETLEAESELGGVLTAADEYRCVHCHTLLEPETTVCSKCGDTPW